MSWIFPPPPTPRLPLATGDGFFPVRRIYCVGHNYAGHSREMGADPQRETPFFFIKPGDCLVGGDAVEFRFPPGSNDVQHEVELVVALSRGGADIEVEAALEHVLGYAVGLDMTRRDLQREAKREGRPWETAKACDGAAPCSALRLASAIGHPGEGAIWLDLNGRPVQRGDISLLVWKVPEVIAAISRFFTLAPGDLIFTGTPAGVGPVQRGDLIHAGVERVGELLVRVV